MARAIANAATGDITFPQDATFFILGDCSWSGWIKLGANSNLGMVCSIETSTGESLATNSLFFVSTSGVSDSWDLQYIHEYGTGANESNVFLTNILDDTWTHITVSRDTTAKTVILYKDGVLVDTFNYTNQPANSTSTINYILLERIDATLPLDDCEMGDVGLWDAALTVDEAVSLSRGVSPNMIRRGNLVNYAPLYGSSPEPDLSGNALNGTVTGTTVVDNPPMGRYVPMPKYLPISIEVQTARPDGDSAIGSWTDDGGGTTNIYQSIDEVTPSDVDYIHSEANPATNSKYVATLSNVNDPAVSTGHIVNYRYRKNNANQTIDMIVRLKQGASTVIASKTHSGISTTWTAGTFTLSGAEADNITDYDDLRIEFDADVP